MPQISKIRIVNFQYNEGKRLIADELYDFESENKGPSDVLINLANGGGKSVLVQLMMQPIIPKAKVAGRRIESFFTKATDHCYIAVEWTLDNSKSKLMTGIAMAASDSAVDSDSDRGFQIKYYTFISNYQNYQGNYNIISLPLSKKENGRFIPASFDDIRNLAKKSNGGLERISSDDAAKWQTRLAEYGIIQNEWRMIEELNSNEDGLSKYFSNLKTSDAVIDKLIIPRIEEKQNTAISKDDSSLETMLISYAKQFSKQQEIIKEREICDGFCSMLETTQTAAEELWKSNDSFEKCIGNLFAFADALHIEIANRKAEAEKINEYKNRLDAEIDHIQWEKVSAEFYICKEAYIKETENLKAAEKEKTEANNKYEEAKKKLLLIECAHYYEQLTVLENQITALSEEITNKENRSESAERLASLKYSAFVAINAELQQTIPVIEMYEEESIDLNSSVSELDRELLTIQRELVAAKTESDKKNAIWEKQLRDDDALVEELGISAFRMFDGKYQVGELDAWQKNAEKEENELKESISASENELSDLEKQKEVLPQEIANASAAQKEFEKELASAEEKLSGYHQAEEQLKAVFEKHGLNFDLRFSNYAAAYFQEQLSAANAVISGEERKIEATEEEISAAARGTLHIPKLISDFLDSAGVRYISVEKYLLTQTEGGFISKEQCLELLEKYPFAAFAVMVDASDMETILSEIEGEWLPSILPLITAMDLSAMLKHEAADFVSLAAYSKDYFLDRNDYTARLQSTLNSQKEHLELLKKRKLDLQTDSEKVSSFAVYDADREKEMLSDIEKIKEDISKQRKIVTQLQKNHSEIKAKISEKQEERESLKESLTGVCSQISGFDKLLKKFEEEDKLYREYVQAEKKLRDLTDNQKEAENRRNKQNEKLKELSEKRKELKTKEQTLHDGLKKVSGASEAELIHAEWQSLLIQYGTLLEAQNAELKGLNDKRDLLLKDAEDKKKEIEKRKCSQEEYAELTYSEDIETEAKSLLKHTEDIYFAAQDKLTAAGKAYGKSEASFENAEDKLKEYGGEALAQNEIGKAFDIRISEARNKFNEIKNAAKEVNVKLEKLQKTQGKAELTTEQYHRPVKYPLMTLEADPASQLSNITKQITGWKDSVTASEHKVEEDLKKVAALYSEGALDISKAITNMQKLLSDESMQGDRYFTLHEQIEINIDIAKKRVAQIDTDLKEFNKTKGDLVHQCLIQGRQMYEGLHQLSNNSKVKVQGKRRQMLRFDIPDTVEENVAIAAITSEIDKGTDEIVIKMAENSYAESDVRKIANRIVGSKRLLRKYIGMENIVLKAYKIDRNPDNSGYRTWEQTQVNNSGAEKFVVYFAVILALMAYARNEYNDADMKGNRSVLILDNPFGPISSKHVLEPMFEISRNYNVQMICLSDISKSDIVSCFDLVIRAVVKRFALSSKEQLTHDGNETIEHGFYRSEQMNIFSMKD